MLREVSGGSWSDFLKRRERKRFTREEQLAIVSAGNLVMLVIVGIVALIGPVPAAFKTLMPVGFWIPEAGIVVVAGSLSMWEPRALIGALTKLVAPLATAPSAKQFIDFARGAALLIVYAAQLFALYSLLDATGGPIHSPYAPMALVTVIFTPFLANNPWTVVVVLVVTAVFYAAVVVAHGTRNGDASGWVYASVNLLIVGLALLPSLGELLRAETNPESG